MAELPHIGKHCNFTQCNQLDFLPFVCDGCGKTFCSEHRVKDIHSCSLDHVTVASGEFDGVKGYTCTLDGCSNRELTPIICEKCTISFCLSHRHPQDHNCSKHQDSNSVERGRTAQHVKVILESKKAEPRKVRGGAKNSKTAAKVALMKMKMNAVGDKSCPEIERVYMKIYPPTQSNKQPLPFFCSKVWSVGRTIDSIADRLGVQNNNNQTLAQKLRLFSSESGVMFPVENDLGSLMKEELVYSGSSVILEYIDDDVECLDDLTVYKIS